MSRTKDRPEGQGDARPLGRIQGMLAASGEARIQRSLTVTYVGAAVGIAVLIGFAAVYLSLDAVALLPAVAVNVVCAGALATVFGFGEAANRLAASLVMNVFVPFPIFLATRLFFGHDFGFQYILILCALVPAISIVTTRWWIPFLLSMVDILYFLTTFNQFPLHDLTGSIPSGLVASMSDFSHVLTIVGVVATVGLYQLAMNQNERKLEHQSQSLSISLEEASRLANQDGLTGIMNRRHLEELLRVEIARAERYGIPLSMIMVDLDHFKRINDTFGHDEGDEVLRRTASLLRGRVRSTDIVARWGGEEFVVVLPHTPLENAMVVAEQLRRAMDDAFGDDRQVTGSFGVVEWEKGETFDDFYGKADEALYTAKETGRDRIAVVAETESRPRPLASIEWKAEWESGDDRIDRQHRKLLRLANDIIAVSLTEVDRAKALALLDDLLKDILHHFSYEEGVLAQIGFVGLEKHRAAHRRLVEDALEMKGAVLRGEKRPISAFVFVLEDVVAGHILNEDSQYYPPLQAATLVGEI